MNQNASALLSGILFGAGLATAQMTNPAKVLGFLDIAGAWDPSLAFVMAGAVLVYGGVYRFSLGVSPIVGGERSMPTRTLIDRRLITGAAIFGFGWGLAGYCPGPGLTSLGAGSVDAIPFVIAMLGGMVAHHVWRKLMPG